MGALCRGVVVAFQQLMLSDFEFGSRIWGLFDTGNGSLGQLAHSGLLTIQLCASGELFALWGSLCRGVVVMFQQLMLSDAGFGSGIWGLFDTKKHKFGPVGSF